VVRSATPAPIRASLETALTAMMEASAWLADARRLGQPLRAMSGAAFGRFVHTEAEALRRLWRQHP
jgi:tripartite-type tricarboxylate transporter receptor subunit TctC